MFIDVASSKKTPRIFLNPKSLEKTPMPGVSWMWPDRSRSSVYNLSLAGMLVSAKGYVGKLKTGEQFESRLDLDEKGTSIQVKVRVEKISATTLSLSFESLSADRRLIIEQGLRDRILIQNLKKMDDVSGLPLQMQTAQWFHGPFDTNFFLWQLNPGYSMEKAIVEYDNLICVFEEGKSLQIYKSGAATEAAKGYFPNLTTTSAGMKIAMGASWLDRLAKCLDIWIEGGYFPADAESLRILKHTFKVHSK